MIELVFVRGNGFYTVECPMLSGQSPADVARDNATSNPGTIRVEDTSGKVLWPVDSERSAKN